MMAGDMELEGKVALVTGGGRRLGKGITEALASAGCVIVIHYGRSREVAEATVRELEERGCEALCLGADLAEVDQIANLFERIEERLGRLDILVNSAASFEKRSLTEITVDAWERVMAVNLRAPFVCTQHAVRLMRAAQRPVGQSAAVINIGDLSGVSAWPGYAHHGVSKAGLLHLTTVAARELAPEIRVNAVIPGPILPPPDADETDPDWQRLAGRLPLARAGQVAEVGAAVRFLAANDFITGETLRVDGGEHLLGAGHRRL
jgi:pteridine reductase